MGINISTGGEQLKDTIKAPSDVSGSRSIGQTFENDTGTALLVTVVIETTGAPAFDLRASFDIITDGNTVTIGPVGVDTDAGETQFISASFTQIIPPGSEYEVRDFGDSSGSINTWVEQELG